MSADAPGDVWAVGSQGQPSFRDRQILVEHWDGSSWRLSPAPDASFNDVLAGVSALSPTDAWAVGSYSTGGTGRNHLLIEHWNGTAWSIQSHPDILGELDAVEAVSTTDVWAVGTAGGKTLAMHWNGASWTQVPTPNRGSQTNALSDISARSSASILAVGTAEAGQPYPGQPSLCFGTGNTGRSARLPPLPPGTP